MAGYLHGQPHSAQAHHRLHKLLSEVIAKAAASGEFRSDIPTGALTHYCLSAFRPAATLDPLLRSSALSP